MPDNTLTFQALTRHAEIGSSSFFLQSGSSKLVLDAGMHPKRPGKETVPQFDLIPEDALDGVIITHSHLDHVGTLPVLMREQPQALVFFTPAGAMLSDAILHNSVNVMTSQCLELSLPEYPLYTHRELDGMQERWHGIKYLIEFEPAPNIFCTMHDAGHILGSSGVMIETQGQKIFYTGDVQFNDQALITGARFPEEEVDTLIMETTRGNSLPSPVGGRKPEEARLIQAIREVIDGGGAVLIPVFAMGKTQEVLTMVHEAKMAGELDEKIPVHIGGLSTKMTVLYDSFANDTPRRIPGFEIFEDMNLATSKHKPRTKRERKPIVSQPGAIFALSSGMMSEHTVSNNFAKGFIQNPKNAILFVGYADPDSPAAAIRRANTGDTIKLTKDSSPEQLNCRIEEYDFSGHANRDELLDYALKVNPRRVFLIHGDPLAAKWFKDQLHDQLPEAEVIIPVPGEEYDIS